MEQAAEVLRLLSAVVSLVVFIGGGGVVVATVRAHGKKVTKIDEDLNNGIKADIATAAANTEAIREDLSDIRNWIAAVQTRVNQHGEALARVEERTHGLRCVRDPKACEDNG